MTVTTRSTDLLERCRRSVFGYLSPLVLHEMNNVLTVMSGIRQLMKAGLELSDRIGPMIDAQLEKVETIMTHVRSLTPEEQEEARGTVADTALQAVAGLLTLAGKGQRIQVRTEAPEGALPADRVEALALGLLCALLPTLPGNGGDAHEYVLRAGASDGSAWLAASIDGGGENLADHPDVDLSHHLLQWYGGALHREQGRERSHVKAVIPEE